MEESDSLSQNEIKILANLQELEAVSLKKEVSQTEVLRVVETIKETLEWISESIESSDVELPLQIIDLMDYLDKVRNCSSENRLQRQAQRLAAFLHDQIQHCHLPSSVGSADIEFGTCRKAVRIFASLFRYLEG